MFTTQTKSPWVLIALFVALPTYTASYLILKGFFEKGVFKLSPFFLAVASTAVFLFVGYLSVRRYLKGAQKNALEADEYYNELISTQTMLNEVLSTIGDVYCKISDPSNIPTIDGQIEYISSSVKNLLGFSSEELIGKSFKYLLEDSDQKAMFKMQLVEKGQLFNVQVNLKAKDGRVVQVLVNAKSVYDANQNYLGVYGVLRDISEVEALKDEVKSTEKRFLQLYHETPALLHSIDESGRIIDVSDYWLKRMGFKEDEVLGKKSVDFMTKESREYALNEVYPVFFEKGHIENVQYQMITKEGEIVDVLLNATSFRDQDGTFLRSNACLIDISERLRMHEQLTESTIELLKTYEFNNLLIDSLNMVSIEMEFPGLTLDVRGNIEQLLGYKKKDITQFSDLENIVHPNDLQTLRKSFILADDGAIIDKEIRLFNKKQDFVWVSAVVKINKTEKNTNSLTGFVYSIDKRKRTERQLLNAQIVVRDRERKKIAQELHDNLGQILTVANINLNGLNESIRGLSRKDQQNFNNAKEMILQAKEEARQISHDLMPTSLLDFGLVASIETDLNRLKTYSNINFSFFENIGKKRFNFEIESNLYSIVREATVNIIKHSKASQASIQIMGDNDILEIVIEDDGIGIKDENQSNGIGLTNIKDRVLSINGDLFIESQFGFLMTIQVPLESD